MMKLGIVLILLSTAIFVVVMTVPDAVKPLAPLFCTAGEHLTNEQSTFSRPGETDTTDTFICEDAEGNQHDITNNVMSASIGAFLVFLVAGVLMTIIGGGRLAKSNDMKYVLPTRDPSHPPREKRGGTADWNTSANAANAKRVNDLKNGLQQGVIRFGGQDIHVDDLKAGNDQMNGGQNGKHTLAETLRQLQEARDQGLIDSDEYGRLRQEALDKLI